MCSSVDHFTTVSMALALVFSHLDYVSYILSGSPLEHIARFQCAQHALARVVLQQCSHARSTPLMEKLCWLPIEWQIRLPRSVIKHYIPVTCHTLQTSYSFAQPQSTRVHLPLSCFLFHMFSSRAFHISAPKFWHTLTLPLHVTQLQSLSAFRCHLKTHYFQLAYPAT